MMTLNNKKNTCTERTCIISKQKKDVANLIKVTHHRKDDSIIINDYLAKGRSVYFDKNYLIKIDQSKLIKQIFNKLKIKPNNNQLSTIEKYLTNTK